MNNICISFLMGIALLFTQSLFAQNKDCNTALEVCGDAPIHFDFNAGIGNPDPGLNNTCLNQEFNSKWFKWTILEGGTITFVLAPDNPDQDLDFMVFYSGSEYDCTIKAIIRCMASGANTGQPPGQWVNCSGPTGLLIGETDVEEAAGCLSTDNNYLAPIEASAGDHYFLMVNDFSNGGSGYILSFGGTAILDCNTVSTNPDEIEHQPIFELSPTISSGTIYIKLGIDHLNDAGLKVYSMTGENVYSIDKIDEANLQVDLPDLPNGAYVAVLTTSSNVLTRKFILAK